MQAGSSGTTLWAPAHPSSRCLSVMKTLVLFSVLMLLAFQAQANPLPEPNEEAKNKEQSGVKDQDVSISFGSPEGSALQDASEW